MKDIARWLGAASVAGLVLAAPVMAQTAGDPPAPPGSQPDPQQADEPAATQPNPGGAPVQNEGGEIVVTGLRRSIQSAQTLKRDSDQILDAVVAEDIGKLPDNNASEALARITGVQVNRSGDEANGVNVRGLPNVTTTFNGREIYTAEGRSVALQDFPAGALAGLEVYKSTTANLVEGGIAGLINVRSRRPFDFTGHELAATARGSYNDQSRKYDPDANLLVSNRWQTGIGEIGALLNVSYTQLHYLTSARFDDGNVVPPNADQVVATPGVGRDIRFPSTVGIFYNRGKRWRPSVNGALQWKPTDRLEFYAEGLWQGYRGRESNDDSHILISPGSPTLSNIVLTPDDPTKVQSLTISDGKGGQGQDHFRGVPNTDTNTFQGAFGGILQGDHFKLSTDIAYTDSTYTLTDYGFDFASRVPPTVNINFDVDKKYGGVEYSYEGYDDTDPNGLIVRGIFDRRLKAHGSGWQSRVDLELDTELPVVERLDFGGRYTTHEADFHDGTRYSNVRALGIPILDAGIGTGKPISPGFRGSDVQDTRTWYAPTRDQIRSGIDTLRAFALAGAIAQGDAGTAAAYSTPLPAYNPNAQFNALERAFAFYGQAHYGFDLLFPIDGVVGVRFVDTDNNLRGISTVAGVLVPRSQNENYIDVLPNASLRAKFTDRLQLRLSATQTRTRPDFGQLNPALNIQPLNVTDVSFGYGGSSGNINLKPITSDNYDASLEWYFSHTGSFTAAVFKRNINGFINTLTTVVPDPTYGTLRLSQPFNAGKGSIKGAEVAFTTFFDALPGWLSGFGAEINGTFINGKQAIQTALGEQVPNVQIPNVSKWSYNLIALYEKGPVSARLAYNYRSHFVNFFSNTNVDDPIAGEFTRSVERLDLSVSVTPLEWITLTFDATNLTRVPFQNVRNYTDTQFYPRDVRYEGRIFSLGARVRF